MISFALTSIILALLVLYKAYNSLLQRLFVYFTLVTLMQLACIAMNIHLQFVFSESEILCKWLGFIQHWAYMMNWLFSLALTFYLIFLVVHQIKGKPLPTIGRKKAILMELVFVCVVIAIPLTVLWIPFSTYGLNGPLCWTQHLLEDCTENTLGGTFELMYTYCCAAVRIVIVVSFLVVFGVYCRLACLYRRTRHHYIKTVGCTVLLTFFLIVSASIELVGLLTYIHSAIGNEHITFAIKKLLQVDYVVLPISLVIIPTGFMVYLYSLKKFTWESIKKAGQEWKWCCACCRYFKRTRQYVRVKKDEATVNENATAPASDRVSDRSDTYFVVPYIYWWFYERKSARTVFHSEETDSELRVREHY